jgi:hypothetical protein
MPKSIFFLSQKCQDAFHIILKVRKTVPLSRSRNADGIRDGKPYRKSHIGLGVYNKRGILYYANSITKYWFSFLNFVSSVVCDIECTRMQTQLKIPRKFESKWVGGGQVFGR